MLISKYGFASVLEFNRVVLDPSRIAAQIVTGIGFIGGGLIFVRRGSVRGLTTAAVVWLTAAVGMACGAGLPILALAVTAGHFIIVLGFPYIAARLPKSRWTPSLLQVSYEDAPEILRDVLITCTQEHFAVSRLQVERLPATNGGRDTAQAAGAGEPMDAGVALSHPDTADRPAEGAPEGIMRVLLEIQGIGSVSRLAAKLSSIDGVVSVHAGDVNVLTD
jgi:putative Mg2+ transporter-C (MgtC) family protein